MEALSLFDWPDQISLSGFKEVFNGQVIDPGDVTVAFFPAQRTVTLSNVVMKDSQTTRFFTFDVVTPSGPALQLVQSTAEPTHPLTDPKPDRFKPLPAVLFSQQSTPGVAQIAVDTSVRFQTLDGFGGAFTDSSAFVFAQLSPENQEAVLEALWGPTGQKYNLARLTIGSTDFSTVAGYNYAPVVGDYDMEYFSIDHDLKQIVPLIHRAQSKAASTGAEIKFLSTPWSPPDWMKRNKQMRNSEKPGLIQTEETMQAYALYLSKYVSAYADQNITVSRLTVQNEPHVAGQFLFTYPCCGFNASQERDFLRDFLGPRLRSDHPSLEIFVHDDQKELAVDYVTTIMADPKAAAFVDGIAFHWYGDFLKNYQYLEQLAAQFPTLPLLATEATLEAPFEQFIGSSSWKQGQMYALDIIGDLNAHTTGWIEWNVLLDHFGGPTCIGPADSTYCSPAIGYCDAPILANLANQTLELRASYFHMGHFSRFIPRGSVRIGQQGAMDNNATLVATSVLTPSGDVVVVVNNAATQSAQFQIQWEGLYALVEIPPQAIQTLTIPNGSNKYL